MFLRGMLSLWVIKDSVSTIATGWASGTGKKIDFGPATCVCACAYLLSPLAELRCSLRCRLVVLISTVSIKFVLHLYCRCSRHLSGGTSASLLCHWWAHGLCAARAEIVAALAQDHRNDVMTNIIGEAGLRVRLVCTVPVLIRCALTATAQAR